MSYDQSKLIFTLKGLPLDLLKIDGGTQSRLKIDEEYIDEIYENMKEDRLYPPVTVFFDGKEYWLADGFHRYHATRKNGKVSIECNITNGLLREAILYSKTANNKHGKRFSLADKIHNAQELIEDFEWGAWSNREIGRICDVSHVTVAKLRIGKVPEKVKFLDKDGEVKTRVTKPPKAEKTFELPATAIPATPADDGKQQEAIDFLVQENEKLTDQLAVKGSTDPELAGKTIAELRDEIKQLTIELNSVKISRDQFQAENAQLKKQVVYLQKQLKAK
jgi:ParB-like chromosome segregation protein Spo0J